MKKYNLTEEQIHKIANLCKQEQGTVVGAKAEASLAANLLETKSSYRKKYGDDIYSFMRNGGWFSRAAYWMDNGDAGSSYDKAIRDVLVNGNRTLPVFVDEHDCFADITSATNNGKAINKKDRSAYIRDVTIIKNRYGSTYTFWTFPTASSDPFGYTNNELRWQEDTAPTAQDILEKAVSYLGVSEPSGDDLFIRYYNRITGSSFSLSDKWCAIFVSAVARMVGVGTDVVPNFADCDDGTRWFRDKGRYAKSAAYGGDYVPNPGDVVFYSSGKTQSDSTHVGYVVQVSNGQLMAIEGNHHDAVGYRTISLTDAKIIGYGRVAEYLRGTDPKDDGDAAYIRGLYASLLKRTPTDVEVSNWVKVLEGGASRDAVKTDFLNSTEYKRLHPELSLPEKVKEFQQWLIRYTGRSLEVDGKCGPATKKSAVMAMQKYLNAFRAAGLSIDGSFGPKTQAAFRSIRKGNLGANVYIVQGLLYGRGFDPAGFDGSFGSGCDAAVRSFQKAAGLTADGICGVKTFAALIK